MKKLTKRMSRTKSWRGKKKKKKKNCGKKKKKKKIVAGEKKKKNNEANWMVSNSAKLDRMTKQHTQFGVSASNGPEIWQGQNRGRKKKKINK